MLRGPAGLPAPVIVATARGRFRVEPDGGICMLGPRTLPVPRSTSWFPRDRSWYRIEHGHLSIGQRHRLLWRSRNGFAGDLGSLAVAGNRISFSWYRGKTAVLYVAQPGGTRREVALGETPLGWTRGGTLITIGRGGLRARSAAGRFEKTFAHRVATPVLDHGAVYW